MRSLTRKIDRAYKANDIATADRLLGDQRSIALQSLLGEEMAAGDGQFPIASMSTTAAHPRVQMEAAALQIARRQLLLPKLLDEHGWGELEAYGDSIVERYKTHNKADRVMPRPGMSEAELQELSYQFEPVRDDPNVIAEWRQRLVKLDNDMKAQLGTSVFNEPRTMRIARMMNAESGPGTPGYLQSKEQDILGHMPLHERALMPVREAVMAGADVMVQFGVGAAATLEKLGVLSLNGLTQGNAAAHYNGATSWVQDKDGSWYHNGGKVGGAEAFAAIWYTLTGNLIDQEMAAHEDARVAARMRSSGIEGLAMDTGHVLGSLLPFAALGGGAMAAGTGLSLKGLGWLATGGGTAANLERAATIVKMLSPAARIAGAGAGLGAYEAIANGHIEGYGAAFLHGASQAPVLMALGLMGRGVERLLHRTTGMPVRMARTLGGAAEGAGFAGIDPHTWDLVWDFIRAPNEDTRAALYRQVASNMLAMAIMKGAGGRSPGERALPEQAKAVEGEAAAREAATTGAQPAEYQRFGELMREAEVLAGREPEAARETLGRAGEAEGEIRAQQAGVDRPRSEQLEARQAARQRLHELSTAPEGAERFEATGRFLRGEPEPAPPEPGVFTEGFRQRLRELHAQPNSPEKRAEIRRLQERMKGALPDLARGAAEAIVEPGAEQTREVFRGAKVVHQLLGKEDLVLTPEQRRLMASRSAAEESKEKRAAREAMEGEAAREEFLEAGPDPMESPRFRDLPPDLQRAVLHADGARARREAVLNWKQTKELLPEELDALRMIPAPERQSAFDEAGAREVAEASPEYSPVLRDPGPPRSDQGPASLRMKPSLELEGVPGTKPTRETDIMLRMQGHEGDPVRPTLRWGTGIRGRFSTKGMLAFFHRHWGTIRMRNDQTGINIALGAHEWSHAMEEAAPMQKSVRQLWRSLTPDERASWFRAAAEYYPGFAKLPKRSQQAEAWAEFWARWMLDDPHLRKETSPFYERAMKWLAGEPALLRQIQEIQGLMRRWRDIGAEGRLESTVRFIEDQQSLEQLQSQGILSDTAPAKAVGAIRRAQRALAKGWVHDVLPIERAEIEALERSGMSRKEAIAAIREIPDADPARTIDRLQLKAGNLAREFFHRNTVDVRGNITGEGFASLFRDIRAERWRDFTKWMVAQHSLEIARKGKLTNLAKEDFLHAAEAIEQRYPEVRDHARRLREFFDRVFDYAIEGGLFTREQVERFKHVSRDPETGQVMDRGYQFYIPFDRVMEPGISQTRLQSRPPVGSSVRTQKGSTHAEIQDPRTSIETLLHRIITDVHRGMAVKSVLKFGLVHKWTGGFVTEVARDRVASQVTMVEIAKQLLQSDNPSAKEVGKVISELIESGDDLGGAITLWDLAKEPRGNRPIISYTPHFTDAEIRALPNKMAQGMARDMNHQLLWLELDREAFNAMRDLGVTQGIVDTWPGFARGLARGPATIKRAGATGLNPIFSVAQIPLDALMKFLSSERSMPLGVLSALGYSIRGMAQILRGSDGAKLWQRLGGGFGQTFTGTELAASMRTGTLSGSKAAEQVQNIADTLSVSEKGNRLDEFEFVRERALAEGRSEEQANALAMEAADKVTIAFTRGGTQARAYGQLVAFFKAGINASEAFFRLFSGAEGAEKQQRAIRRAFFGIALPAIAYWWLNKDEPWFQDLTEEDRLNYWWLKVPGMDSPLRFKKGSVGMVFSSSMETILGLATEKDPVGVSDLVAQTATSFLPSNFLPDTGAPVLEWAWNRSLFSGRPTVPEWMEKHRVPADQGMPFTRTPSWWLGRVLNLSPAKIERAAETFTGGLYGRGLDLLEGIGTLAGATTSEGFSARKLPIIGQAFVRGGMRSRAVETLYDLHRDLEQRHGSGVLDFRGQEARNITQNVIDRIAALHRAGGAGQLTRQQVRDQAAELARQALQSIRR